MSLQALYRREDAVSKVVGVVLMVAITVLLVTVIGVMVGGMTEESPTQADIGAIQASFSFSFEDNATYDPNPTGQEPGAGQIAPYDAYTADNLTITYEGGTKLDSGNVVVQMRGSGTGFKYIKSSGDLGGGASHQSSRTLADVGAPTELTAGDSVIITTILDDVYGTNWPGLTSEMNGATVRIVYQHPSTDRTYVLAEWTGPSA